MRRPLAQLIDRYIKETLPLKPRNLSRKDVEHHLRWWKDEMGDYSLANVTAALINEQKTKLARGMTERGTQRSPATVNRYLAALSGCLKTAVREYGWLESSPMAKISKFEEARGRVRFSGRRSASSPQGGGAHARR